MKIVTEIPPECFVTPRVSALLARDYVRALARANEVYLRVCPNTPGLYSSGVKYQREPNAGQYEEFAAIPTVLNRGWGDCDDLVAWRVAEYRQVLKRPADVMIYWRPKTNVFHLQVRYWPSADARRSGHPGDVEDPSRLCGMGITE